MSERVKAELSMLRSCYPDLELEAGPWVKIPSYRLPSSHWSMETVAVCFEIPQPYPGQPPYGCCVQRDVRLLPDSAVPENYAFPAETRYSGEWGTFAWQLESWAPAANPASGSNLLNFVRSFADRFRQG